MICIVKAMVFPVLMYGCERWTLKKAEHRRINAFELWCWRRRLRVPLTARRSNQSILKEINPKYSLEGLMLKLKFKYFGHLMSWLIRKDSDAGKDWWQEEKGMAEDEMVRWHHWLNGHECEKTSGDDEVWHAAIHGVTKSQTWLSNWTTTISHTDLKDYDSVNWFFWWSVEWKKSSWQPRGLCPFDSCFTHRMEKAMAPHSSTLAWKIPWMEEPGRLQSMGSLRVGHNWVTSLSLSCIGEGNGNPLQCSCLENPRDGGAWWVSVYGVTQSWTWLKWLSSSSSSREHVRMRD